MAHPEHIAQRLDRIEYLRGLEPYVQSKVIGQPLGVSVICAALRAGEMGHTMPGSPKSLILILGPTGSGKTKALMEASRYLYGTDAIGRVDLAEFSTEVAIPRLLGAGRDDRGVMGDVFADMKAKGGKILLLDEVEKAHKKVSDMLLGVEAARLRTADGVLHDLSDYHIAATSNLAARELAEAEDMPHSTIKRVVEDAAKEFFRPEVFARFSGVVIYRKLKQDAQLLICQQMLSEEIAYQQSVLAAEYGHAHEIKLTEGVFRRLVNEGYHRELGARPMRNVVQKRVRDAIVNARLAGFLAPGVSVSWLAVDGANGLRLTVPRTTGVAV